MFEVYDGSGASLTLRRSPAQVDGAAEACVVPPRLLSWLKASVNRGLVGVAGSGLKVRVVNHRIP